MKSTLRHVFIFAWKELLTNLRNLRLPLALLLLPPLAVLGSVVTSLEYREKAALVRAGLREQETQLEKAFAIEDLRERAYEVLGEGLHYYRMPPPTSVLVTGVEELLPVDFHAISSMGRWDLRLETDKPSGRLYGNPLWERFPKPDIVISFGLVASLLALWFGADSLTREREMETLKVALANPVSRSAVILGKQLGGFISIWFALAIALVAAIAVGTIVGQVPISRDLAVRWIWLGAISTLYVAAWFGIGLLVSAACRSSSTALISGLCVWLVLVMVWPGVAAVSARTLKPVAPRPKIDAWKVDWEAASRYQGLKRASDEFVVPREKRAEERAKIEVIYAHEATLKQQRELATLISRFSPVGSFGFAMTEIAGTGPTSYELVTRADRKYGEDYYEWALKLSLKATASAATPISESEISRGALPTFDLPALLALEGLRNALVDVLLLAGWCVIVSLLAYMVFLRQEVA